MGCQAAGGETLVTADVFDEKGAAFLSDPAGNAFPDPDAGPFDDILVETAGAADDQVVGQLVFEHDGAGVDGENFGEKIEKQVEGGIDGGIDPLARTLGDYDPDAETSLFLGGFKLPAVGFGRFARQVELELRLRILGPVDVAGREEKFFNFLRYLRAQLQRERDQFILFGQYLDPAAALQIGQDPLDQVDENLGQEDVVPGNVRNIRREIQIDPDLFADQGALQQP